MRSTVAQLYVVTSALAQTNAPALNSGPCVGLARDLMVLTRTGAQATLTTETRDWILAAYREYVEHGHVRFSCDEDAVEQFSQVQMAKRVAEALDYACDLRVMGRARCNSLGSTGKDRSRETGRSKREPSHCYELYLGCAAAHVARGFTGSPKVLACRQMAGCLEFGQCKEGPQQYCSSCPSGERRR